MDKSVDGSAKSRKADDLAKEIEIPGLELNTIDDCKQFIRGQIRYIAKVAYKDATGGSKGAGGKSVDKSREILRNAGTLEKAMSSVSQYLVPLLRDQGAQEMEILANDVNKMRQEMENMAKRAEKDKRTIDELYTQVELKPKAVAG